MGRMALGMEMRMGEMEGVPSIEGEPQDLLTNPIPTHVRPPPGNEVVESYHVQREVSRGAPWHATPGLPKG